MLSRFASTVLGRGPLSARLSSRISRAAIACGILFVAFLLANLLTFRYGRDHGIYGVVAEAILRGKAPYKDAWDFKPPAVFFVFALARVLFGSGETAVRMLEALLWASVPICFATFVARRGADARLGFFGGVLAVYIHVRKEYWHTSQPESFGAISLIWALALVDAAASAAPNPRALLRWLVAGALFGAAALLKPPLGGGFVLLLAAWLWERRSTLPSGRAAQTVTAYVLATLVGVALPIASTFLFFESRGAWGALVETLFEFAPHYTKLDTRPALLPGHIVRATYELLLFFTPMLAPALLVATSLVGRENRRRLGVVPVLAVIAAPFFGIALQGKFFPYHYDGCLPFVCLFATAGYAAIFAKLTERGLPRALHVLAFAAVLAGFYSWGPYINPGSIFWDRVPMRVSALLHPSRRAALEDEMTSEADVRSAENRRLSSWIRATLPADSSILVWGFEPIVYLSSQRRPATRYIYDVPQRVPWSREASCASLREDLENDPPEAIAVEHEDRLIAVTGTKNDSSEELGACPWLPPMIEREYREAWHSPKFTVFRRAPSVAGERGR